MPNFISKPSKIPVLDDFYGSNRLFYSHNNQLKELIDSALAEVEIRINGDRPWDIQVHNENLYQRVISEGSLGLGEAYVEEWWDCQQIDELFTRILRGRLQDRIGSNNLGSWFIIVGTKLWNSKICRGVFR